MLLMIDNYDSFTFNLVHYFRELGIEVLVKRNDEITLSEIEDINPNYLVISPGPSTPQNAGITLATINHFKEMIPILGVCLGHQAIAEAFGGHVVHAHQVMHGKTSKVRHFNKSVLFKDIPEFYTVTRYHSLIAERSSLPDCFVITAEDTDKGEIMAMEHRKLPIYGVQFHPESIKTEYGHQLLQNFLNVV